MASPFDDDEASETITDVALRLASRGFKIIPLYGIKTLRDGRRVCQCPEGVKCSSAGKHPRENDWVHNYYESGADVADLWQKYPGCNYGIVCGSEFGYCAVDIDRHTAQADGFQSMETILQMAGGIAGGAIWIAGRVHTTPRGGAHHFYRLPPPVDGKSFRSRSDILWDGCGVDFKSDGGYVVGPGSVTPDGEYTEQHVNPLMELPPWLRGWIAQRQNWVKPAPLPDWEPPPGPAELPDDLLALMSDLDAVPRYRHLFRIAAAARRADLSIGQAYALCLEWVQANQLAHPEVPGKWAGPSQPRLIAADLSRNWSKLEAERQRLEVHLPFDAPVDPHDLEIARQGLQEAVVDVSEGGPDFSRLARRLPDLETAARFVTKHEPVDWGGLEVDLPPAKWLVPHLIEQGRFILLYAREGAGKSLVLQQQMGAAVAGRILEGTGGDGTPATVLYLDRENGWPDLHERYNAAGFKPEDLHRLKYVLVDDMPMLNTRPGAQELLTLAYRYRADAIVIDTFSRFVDGEINAPDAPNAFFREAAKPLTDAGIAVVVLDHMAKDERVTGPIGSKAKTTSPHVVWRMWRKSETQLRLKCEKDRQKHVPPYLRCIQKSNPLNFLFEPMTKREYRTENSAAAAGDDDIPPEERTKRPPGRPQKSDVDKILPIVARLDAVFGADGEPAWSEARNAVKGDSNLIKPALEYRRLRQERSPRVGFAEDDT